jgi:hypothetical protein
VQLRDYEALEPPLPREAFFEDEEIRDGLRALLDSEKGHSLFYNKQLELNQGAYLTPAPQKLVALLDQAYQKIAGKPLPYSGVDESSSIPKYTIEDAVEELFLPLERAERILAVWEAKKNIILQGPPGVGKSFAARELAYAFLGVRAPHQIGFVQFHQSYSYEDFIQGYRPTANGFELRTGRFLEFCRLAEKSPKQRFVFIIDEINRGNLSKILGELMLLIEADKRGPNWSLPLAYSNTNETFSVPENVYLLGLMNTADRSLAVVDYALRRRFGFCDLIPEFNSEKFGSHLRSNDISDELIELIRQRIGELNKEISGDQVNLGRGFCIGHSFFCTKRDEISSEAEWYNLVIDTEIIPLLEEYWFDNPNKVAHWRERLTAST